MGFLQMTNKLRINEIAKLSADFTVARFGNSVKTFLQQRKARSGKKSIGLI